MMSGGENHGSPWSLFTTSTFSSQTTIDVRSQKTQLLAPAWLSALHFCSFTRSGRCFPCSLLPLCLSSILSFYILSSVKFLFVTERFCKSITIQSQPTPSKMSTLSGLGQVFETLVCFNGKGHASNLDVHQQMNG